MSNSRMECLLDVMTTLYLNKLFLWDLKEVGVICLFFEQSLYAISCQ